MGMRPPGVSGTPLQAIKSTPVISSPIHTSANTHNSLAEHTNRHHVETHRAPRRCAGSARPGAALLHGWRSPEVLLRGIAQGYIGRWYDMPFTS